MKLKFIYISLALLIAGCSKVNNGGTYTISGTLLNNCEDQEPVANEELYFLVDWEAPEEERFATTDANGNFEYTFEGPPNNESVIGGSIRLTNEKVVLCGIPNSSFDKEMDAGVIYASSPRKVDITFKIQGDGFSNKDTLILSKVFHTDLRITSTLKLAGPFDEETEITEEWWKYASSGNRTMPGYTSVVQPHVRRLNGTFGSKCYWQVRRNGEVHKANSASTLLSACENDAVMSINPNNGYDD